MFSIVRCGALICAAFAMALFVAPASARPHHGVHSHKVHHAKFHKRKLHRSYARHRRGMRARHYARSRSYRGAWRHHARHHGRYHARRYARYTNRYRSVRRHHAMRRHHVARRYVAQARHASRRHTRPVAVDVSASRSPLVAVARRYMGTNPTGRSRLWCARFMNLVLKRTGHKGTGSDMARSFVSYGTRVRGPQVGSIAVLSRGRRGGHVGIVTGIDRRGNPIIISGNHGRRVGEGAYPRSRVLAYVKP